MRHGDSGRPDLPLVWGNEDRTVSLHYGSREGLKTTAEITQGHVLGVACKTQRQRERVRSLSFFVRTFGKGFILTIYTIDTGPH